MVRDERVELIIAELRRQAVLQIAVDDRRDGLPDAVDARHQRAAGDEADQQTRRSRAPRRRRPGRTRSAAPAARTARCRGRPAGCSLPSSATCTRRRPDCPVSAHVDLDACSCRAPPARRRGHADRLPASGCSDASVSSRIRSPAICMCTRASMKLFSASRAVAPKDVGEPLRIGLQDLAAAILDRDLPGIPQRRGEQHQRGDPQDDVAERQTTARMSASC